jgi:hypothetical protein
LVSNDGHQPVQDAQINTPENNPSITSTSRLPKLEATKANNPLPGNTTQAKNTPTLPITDNLPLQPTNSAEKSENTVQTEPTNLIALTEDLQNAESQAALATTSLQTKLQPANGELIADRDSGDATQASRAQLETLDELLTPLSPNPKPTSQPTPAATEELQANLPDSQQPEPTKIPVDAKPPTDKANPTENQKPSTFIPPAVGTSLGIDHATKDAKMISLATFDSTEIAAIAPAEDSAGLEAPAISSDRLSTAKPLAVSSTVPLPATDKGADSNFAQLSSGNPLVSPTPESQQTPTHAASQAAAVLKTLPVEISKLQQSNQSQIQLDLPVGDNESVRIRLSLRGGEIHSTFITESAELRDALQKAWPDFTATHRTQGMRFADSQFQDGLRQQNDAASDQGRQRQYQQESSSPYSDNRQPIVKKNIPQPPTQTNRQGKLNLWA